MASLVDVTPPLGVFIKESLLDCGVDCVVCDVACSVQYPATSLDVKPGRSGGSLPYPPVELSDDPAFILAQLRSKAAKRKAKVQYALVSPA